MATLKERYNDLQVDQGPARARAAVGAQDDPFILKLIQLVLSYGVEIKASDVHIEPTAAGARIRYRIDGILHEMLQVPPETRDALARAIKVKANMVNEAVGRSKPQDGRIDFEASGRKVDLRLSSFPTIFGDVLAVRIFDGSAALMELGQIGFEPAMLKNFERLIRRPNGLLLVTGPAGSGKTTTLYAALNKLQSPHVKIVTLEDPVEYQVDGIDQAQINPAIGLTFASGLRAILRQDTNVILVGEIRDTETAEIVISAALTGHLVLSTIHTRHALGVVARFMDMGVEPHLIVAALNGVVAQRLVRLVCPQCKSHEPLAEKTFTRLWTKETGIAPSGEHLSQLCVGKGCPACNLTGYRGRTGIFELLVPDSALNALIIERASGQLYKQAVASGTFRTMLLSGLEKAAAGLTTVHEVLRVIGETEDG